MTEKLCKCKKFSGYTVGYICRSCHLSIYTKEQKAEVDALRKGTMSDTFRKEYKPLSDEAKAWMNDVKEKAEQLLLAIDKPRNADFSGNREIAVAKTNLEQAVMWAVKGITS